MLATQDLGGDWKLRWSDVQRGGKPDNACLPTIDPAFDLTARVPGEVHLDLERAGILPDRNRGLGHLTARWVETCRWTYHRRFSAPPEARAARAWLVFDGLDLDAVVLLDGVEVGRHANSFRPCRIEVTGRLGADNHLVVHIESGLFGAADKPSAGFLHPYDQPCKRHWLRKPQCQAGWDWSPRLLNVGIQGPVRLEWTAAAARLDQVAVTASLDEDLATGHLLARAFVENLGRTDLPVTVAVHCAGRCAEAVSTLPAGLHPCPVALAVPQPRLWWPVGQGEPSRYAVEVVVSADGVELGRQRVQVGFRHIRIDQSPCPAGGRWFYLEINRRRVFCSGGNYVPADTVVAAIAPERSRRLVELAVEQNFNLLRVWGGGRYEDAAFYDACDELGVLVWQEFIFACARYPGSDDAFYHEVAAEAAWQVRRLSSRPSLIAWCGNNEIEQGYWDWGWDRGNPLPDHQLYHHLLPGVVAREDGTRHWQPSSPFSPDYLPANRDDVGDQHPWSVGFAETDYRRYRRMDCRFPNEGGILGPASLPTVRACLGAGEERPWSFAWQQHDNAVAHWQEPSASDGMVSQWLGRDLRAMSIADYVYWAGLVQGEGLGEYIANFRRRRSTTTGAAIFWMYNDTWPAVRSWTTVDYYLRRTPSFHPVRRAFQPISVVVHEDGDDLVVTGINDTPQEQRATLRAGVFALAGGYPLDTSAEVVLAANAATRLAAFPRTALGDPLRHAAFAALSRDGRTLARHRLILPLLRELAWPVAQPQVALADGQAVFTSPVFCLAVCLDLDGERELPDNFFDLWPDQPYALPWAEAAPPRILAVGNLG